MIRAIAAARKGMRAGEGGPFGACLVKNGRILAVSRNRVLKTQDATCHAEMNVIREACRKLRTFDLSGTRIYSTTEPCPMCFSAIHWARITEVCYGTAIKDVWKRGFNELSVPSRLLKRRGKSPVRIRGRYMLRECRKLLSDWDKLPVKKTY